MQNKNYISFFIIIIFFLAAIFLISQSKESPAQKNTSSENIKHVRVAGQEIKVDLAQTKEEQEQGLSGRPGLDNDAGMLFIFDQPGLYPFWMKDMNFPIDMIWISSGLKVVYIKKNATPQSYPESFGPQISGQEAKYVLEVNSGFSDKNNLKIGDSMEFDF